MFYAPVDPFCRLFLKLCETGLFHDLLVYFSISDSHFLSVGMGNVLGRFIIEGPQHFLEKYM